MDEAENSRERSKLLSAGENGLKSPNGTAFNALAEQVSTLKFRFIFDGLAVHRSRTSRKARRLVRENLQFACIILAVIVGILVGSVLRQYSLSPGALQLINFPGEIFLRLLKLLILPLIVTSLVSGMFINDVSRLKAYPRDIACWPYSACADGRRRSKAHGVLDAGILCTYYNARCHCTTSSTFRAFRLF